MISNFITQAQEQGQIDKLPAVLEEVPRVKADMGHPPLVTPSSQIVGTQAVFNVLLGERYKIVTNEVKDYFRGLYGKPPAPVDPEIQKKVIGDEEPIKDRPADHIAPGYQKAKEELGALYTKEEDVLSYALFPPQAKKFLRRGWPPAPESTRTSWSSPRRTTRWDTCLCNLCRPLDGLEPPRAILLNVEDTNLGRRRAGYGRGVVFLSRGGYII